MKKPKNRKAAAKAGKADSAPKRGPGRPPKTAAQKAAKSKAKQETRVEAAKAAVGLPGSDPKKREKFLYFSPKYALLKKRAASVNGELRNLLKEADKDGFTKGQFEVAALVSTPEGEAKVRERIGKELEAAQFVGSMLGTQLSLFNEPDRTPAVDRAYSEGQAAAMQNIAAVPPYAPDTEQFRAFMKGFHDHSASIVADKLKKKTEPPKAPKADKAAKAPPAAPPPAPGNVVPMTRSQMLAQEQAQQSQSQEADEAGDGGDDDDGGFARRPAASAAAH